MDHLTLGIFWLAFCVACNIREPRLRGVVMLGTVVLMVLSYLVP